MVPDRRGPSALPRVVTRVSLQPRIEGLWERVRAPRARHADLTVAIEEEQLTGPTPRSWRCFDPGSAPPSRTVR